MKPNIKVNFAFLFFIISTFFVLSCSKNDSSTQNAPNTTPPKPKIKVMVSIIGNFAAYSINHYSGSKSTKRMNGDHFDIVQGDRIYAFNGLPNNETGSINIHHITDSLPPQFITGLTKKHQFEFEWTYK